MWQVCYRLRVTYQMILLLGKVFLTLNVRFFLQENSKKLEMRRQNTFDEESIFRKENALIDFESDYHNIYVQKSGLLW